MIVLFGLQAIMIRKSKATLLQLDCESLQASLLSVLLLALIRVCIFFPFFNFTVLPVKRHESRVSHYKLELMCLLSGNNAKKHVKKYPQLRMKHLSNVFNLACTKLVSVNFYKPYACQHTNCNKRFANKFLLKKHEFIHTGERPHQCPYCCKRFNRKDNLLRHKKTHESNSVMMKQRSNRIFDSGESMSPVDDSNLKTLDQFANDLPPPGSCDHERFSAAAGDATNTKLNENEENKQITTT
ncbi:zinc finger, C2H2 type, partial [Trichinella nativa]